MAGELASAVSSGTRMNADEAKRTSLWRAFQHDTNVATNSLLYLLNGIHATREVMLQTLEHMRDRSGRAQGTIEDYARIHKDMCFTPPWPDLRVFPWLQGEPLIERTAPDGPLEQHVLRAWVVDVFGLWENHYRTELERSYGALPGIIRPRQDVLGDLRLIRNNLLHGGVAKGKEAADCKILRWFGEGARMQVRLRHVLDFLNQMDWLTADPVHIFDQPGPPRTSRWDILREKPQEGVPPPLVSIRPLLTPDAEDPRYRYGASIAFEDGVFGRIPMGPLGGGSPQLDALWQKMKMDDDGNLKVPGADAVPAGELYGLCLKPRTRGPGVWSRWVQFRKGEGG